MTDRRDVHWSKPGDEEAERDKIERERLVISAKRATLDARLIVQAAEVNYRQGKAKIKDVYVYV